MLCERPVSIGGRIGIVGCGQCLPCKINRRRVWTHRLLLESMQHSDNAFVTLTYDDDHLPLTSDGRGNLVPEDLKNWLKRFRKSIEPSRIRFYGVGEYGERDERPHYHVAVFGHPTCAWGQSRYGFRKNCCAVCDNIRDTWGLGHVFVARLEEQSAQYIAGYVVKKMTAPDDARLDGRHPEFARMSNQNGGIGFGALHDLASTVLDFDLVEREGDVPSALRHGTRILPLGRYLRRKLRTLVGMEENAPQATLDKVYAEVQRLRDAAFEVEKPISQVSIEENKQKFRQIDARYKIRNSKRKL